MKIFENRSRAGGPFLLALLGLTILAAHGCAGPSTLGPATDRACVTDADCPAGLLCAFARCSVVCRDDTDCGHAGDCVFDSAMRAVCEYPDVQSCTKPSDCAPPLGCASDGKCRNVCTQDSDCNVSGITGRACATDATGARSCASLSELGDTGLLGPSSSAGLEASTQGSEPDATTGAGEAGEPDGEGPDAADTGPQPAECVPGAPCSPGGCQSGEYACGSSGMVCEAKIPLSDGTPCTPAASGASDAGAAGFCSGGACVVCNAGADCSLTGGCQKKAIDCSSGKAACMAAGSMPDGTSCGSGMYCYSGVCSACTVGQTCTPANPCHKGTVSSCSGGIATCADATVPAANGIACGVNKVCSAGSCNACTANLGCVPANPCHTGITSCATGHSVCVDTVTNAADGSPCGKNLVCSVGKCVSCTGGALCTPANVCHVGGISCSSGLPVCVDTTANIANGTKCGLNKVCSAGSCNACTPGGACVPTNTCDTGQFSCASGVQTCVDTGPNPAKTGMHCGSASSAEVCNNGVCGACAAGTSCPFTSNICDNGKISCTSGAPTCVDNGPSSAANGSLCGKSAICANGACVPCQAPTIAGATSFCAGGSTTLTATAGDSYSWSTGATTQAISVNMPGVYGVTVTSGNCALASAPVTVTSHALPSAAFSWIPAMPNASSPATFTATMGGETDAWAFSNGSPPTSSLSSPSVTWSAYGTYGAQLTVTDPSTGCSSTSSQNVPVCDLLGPPGIGPLTTPDFDMNVHGLTFTALASTKIRQLAFWNQGGGDTLTLVGDDGAPAQMAAVPPGSPNPFPVNVSWSITAGTTYTLSNGAPGNANQTFFFGFPTVSTNLQVTGSFSEDTMGDPPVAEPGVWEAFTELRTCPN